MPAPAWVQGRLQKEPPFSRFVYNTFFKRSSSMMTTVIVFATGATIGYEYFMRAIWNFNNKGVRCGLSDAARPHLILHPAN